MRAQRNRGEQGFALMLAVFLTALLVIAAVVAAPSVKNERQREKEQEMIWRGKQYVRAIKLYYRKNGRFPAKLDDLVKPQQGQGGTMRFLRQAYKDPMNKEDGSWRLIYVGPAGQLIGSTKPPQTMQMVAGTGALGTPSTGTPTTGTPSSGFGSAFNNSQNTQQGTAGNNQSSFGQSAFGQSSPGQGNGADGNPPAPVDTSNFIGGNIIGVGSKAQKPSIIVYEKATNYHQFEFIWDPSKDAITMGGGVTGAGTGTGTGFGAQPSAPGQTPGSSFGNQGTFGNPPNQQPPPSQPGNPNPQPNEPPLSNDPQ